MVTEKEVRLQAAAASLKVEALDWLESITPLRIKMTLEPEIEEVKT